MPTLVTMPKWGLTMQSGTITEWIAAEGESVSAGAPLLTVETEKAVNDVEAPADGVLLKIVAATGAEVPVSGPVAVIAAPGEAVSDDELAALLAAHAPAAGAAASGGDAAAAGPARQARAATRDSSGRISASPAARKLAGELGIDLATVEATGPGGRITSDDIERAAAALASQAAAPQETRIEATDGGIGLNALLAGPADAQTRIVFLHGLGGSLSTWAAVLGDFAEEHRVAALDLPGHGKSDKPDASGFDYSVATLAQAVGAAMTAAGLAPAVVVGHSLGAAVALQLTLERPKLVRGLVLMNGAGLGPEISAELLDLVEAEPSRDVAQSTLELFFEDKRLVNNRGIEDLLSNRTNPGADAAQKAVAAAAFDHDGQKIDFASRLGEVTTPTYLIWGEFDRVVPVGHAAKAAEAIEGSWLDVISGSGHVPQVEAAATVTGLVKHWLTRLPEPEPDPEPETEPEAAPAAEAAPAEIAAEPSSDDAAGEAPGDEQPAGESAAPAAAADAPEGDADAAGSEGKPGAAQA